MNTSANDRFTFQLLERAYQSCRSRSRRHATHQYTPIADDDMVDTVARCWATCEEGMRLQIAASLLARFSRERLAARLGQVKALLETRGVQEWYWPDERDPRAAEFVAEALAYLRWSNWQDAGIAPAIIDLTDKEIVAWLHTRQLRDLKSRPVQTSNGIAQQLVFFGEVAP